jgi:phage terminase small subunit
MANMPIKGGKMTHQERVFAERFAVSGDKAYSARAAGYASPHAAAHKNLTKPAVQAEIARQQTERLFSEALPAAVQCLVSIINSDKAPAGARVQAAKVVLDRTLGSEDAGKQREPHEMSPDELAKEIDKLTRIAADRARPIVEQEPTEKPPTIDLFA